MDMQGARAKKGNHSCTQPNNNRVRTTQERIRTTKTEDDRTHTRGKKDGNTMAKYSIHGRAKDITTGPS